MLDGPEGPFAVILSSYPSVRTMLCDPYGTGIHHGIGQGVLKKLHGRKKVGHLERSKSAFVGRAPSSCSVVCFKLNFASFVLTSEKSHQNIASLSEGLEVTLGIPVLHLSFQVARDLAGDTIQANGICDSAQLFPCA
jgi:hypothetical protein